MSFGYQTIAGGEDLGFKVTKLMKRSGTGTGAHVHVDGSSLVSLA